MSELEHFDQELVALDQQIVRLGALCGLDTTHEDVISAILRGDIGPDSLPQTLRKPFMLLKGLLALRYHVEKHCVEDLGPAQCQHILQSTQLK